MYAARLAPRHAMSEAPHSLGVSDSRHSLAAAAVAVSRSSACRSVEHSRNAPNTCSRTRGNSCVRRRKMGRAAGSPRCDGMMRRIQLPSQGGAKAEIGLFFEKNVLASFLHRSSAFFLFSLSAPASVLLDFWHRTSAMRHECELRDGAPTVARMTTRAGAIDQR